MKMASISETKNQLSALLDQVKQGETILITDRNQPVARLEPVTGSNVQSDEERLNALERMGVLRRGKGAVPKSLIRAKPPKAKEGASILDALLEERRTGR